MKANQRLIGSIVARRHEPHKPIGVLTGCNGNYGRVMRTPFLGRIDNFNVALAHLVLYERPTPPPEPKPFNPEAQEMVTPASKPLITRMTAGPEGIILENLIVDWSKPIHLPGLRITRRPQKTGIFFARMRLLRRVKEALRLILYKRVLEDV